MLSNFESNPAPTQKDQFLQSLYETCIQNCNTEDKSIETENDKKDCFRSDVTFCPQLKISAQEYRPNGSEKLGVNLDASYESESEDEVVYRGKVVQEDSEKLKNILRMDARIRDYVNEDVANMRENEEKMRIKWREFQEWKKEKQEKFDSVKAELEQIRKDHPILEETKKFSDLLVNPFAVEFKTREEELKNEEKIYQKCLEQKLKVREEILSKLSKAEFGNQTIEPALNFKNHRKQLIFNSQQTQKANENFEFQIENFGNLYEVIFTVRAHIKGISIRSSDQNEPDKNFGSKTLGDSVQKRCDIFYQNVSSVQIIQDSSTKVIRNQMFKYNKLQTIQFGNSVLLQMPLITYDSKTEHHVFKLTQNEQIVGLYGSFIQSSRDHQILSKLGIIISY